MNEPGICNVCSFQIFTRTGIIYGKHGQGVEQPSAILAYFRSMNSLKGHICKDKKKVFMQYNFDIRRKIYYPQFLG